MSAFLSNLAARARGTLPRLAPRRPGPFETLGAEPTDSDRPVPSMSFEAPSSTPRTSEVVPPASAPVAGPTISAAATTVPRSIHAAAPVTPAAPAPAAPSRRMIPLAPTAAVAPAALASRSAVTPPVATSSKAVLAAETPPVAHAPVSPPIAPSAPVAVIATGTIADDLRDMSGEKARADPEPAASPVAVDGRPLSRSSIVPVPRAAPPLLAREDIAPNWGVQVPRGRNPERAAEPQQPPQVEVRIGTIEVVVDPPRGAQPAPIKAEARGISLDDFLDGRGGR
jgi:hypothetical protein